MKIYTGTGDEGTTSLFNGSRVPKTHVLVHAYGIVDECNAAIGLACSHLQTFVPSPDHKHMCHPSERPILIARLQLVQNFLFDLGAYLATPRKKSPTFKVIRTEFPERAATDLERWIDDMDTKLPELSTFLLPGGHPASASLHIGRTIARRAERLLTPLMVNKIALDSTHYYYYCRCAIYRKERLLSENERIFHVVDAIFKQNSHHFLISAANIMLRDHSGDKLSLCLWKHCLKSNFFLLSARITSDSFENALIHCII
ncbi:unnamed protein product [Agarophyton chilense]